MSEFLSEHMKNPPETCILCKNKPKVMGMYIPTTEKERWILNIPENKKSHIVYWICHKHMKEGETTMKAVEAEIRGDILRNGIPTNQHRDFGKEEPQQYEGKYRNRKDWMYNT